MAAAGSTHQQLNNQYVEKNNLESFRSRLDERITNLQLSMSEIYLMRLNLSLLDFPNEIPNTLLNNHTQHSNTVDDNTPNMNCNSSQNNIKLIKRYTNAEGLCFWVWWLPTSLFTTGVQNLTHILWVTASEIVPFLFTSLSAPINQNQPQTPSNRSFKESLYEKEKNINRLIMYFTIWREMLLKAEFVSIPARCVRAA